MTKVDIILPRQHFDIEVNETFAEGITGIYGPSGSGKSSLLHAMAGLAVPRKGSISVAGNVLYDSQKKINIPVEKRNIGYVFQEGRLFPHMNIEKNLLYGMKRNVGNKIMFNEVVDLLNLRNLLKSKPSQISGGERQRTALGRTLLSSPDILLLDEPFSAVDVSLRNQILPFIIRIQQKVQVPVLVVSHDLTDLLKLTNTLFLMDRGRVTGHGLYFDLLKNKDASGLIGKNHLVNSVEMKVVQPASAGGQSILSHEESKVRVLMKCDKLKNGCEAGQRIRVFINSDDIALSLNKLEQVTIQNQLQATVTDIIDRGSSLLCIVDAGFRLVVEITADSKNRLNINPGSRVWCLIKSVAIEAA